MPDKLAFAQAVVFVTLLCAVSVFDLKRRIIPDTLNLAIAASSLLCFSWSNLWGIAAALPFLLAAVFCGAGNPCGGMGGGDIKLMAACGLVLGLPKGLLAAAVGLSLLLLYVAGYRMYCKVRGREAVKAFPLAPFLSAGCLLAYFI
ncbi:MAG: prepilin peptidase [Oscillospiraceae bacterium]